MGIKLKQRFLRRVMKSLPLHGVGAIGRKCAGLEASWLVEALAISLIADNWLLLHLRPNYIHSASNDIHTDGLRARARARARARG